VETTVKPSVFQLKTLLIALHQCTFTCHKVSTNIASCGVTLIISSEEKGKLSQCYSLKQLNEGNV